MLQKRMFKVLSPIAKRDGGTYWMRTGSAFTNKDESINVILDAIPRGEWKFQLRELDAEDLRKRELYGNISANDSQPAENAAGAFRASGTGVPF